MALEEQLEGTPLSKGGPRKETFFKASLYTPSAMLLESLDTSKEMWGAHFREHIARGAWSLPKSKLHKLLGTKGSLSGPKRVLRPLLTQHNFCRNI